MKSLKQSIMAAGILAVSSAGAEETPSLKFENITPVRGFELLGMNTRNYGFGEVNDGKTITLHGGMYDELVGLACEWTLQGPVKIGTSFQHAEVIHHVCMKGKEPEAWAAYHSTRMHESAGVKKGMLMDIGSIMEVFRTYSGTESAKDVLSMGVLMRQWRTETQEVCLTSSFGDIPKETKTDSSIGKGWDNNYKTKGQIDNGCYVLSPEEFQKKAAVALRPQEPI